MIFKRLEIVLVSTPSQSEMIIKLEDEQTDHTWQRIIPVDHLVSMFDYLFDLAKHELKQALEKSEGVTP